MFIKHFIGITLFFALLMSLMTAFTIIWLGITGILMMYTDLIICIIGSFISFVVGMALFIMTLLKVSGIIWDKFDLDDL